MVKELHLHDRALQNLMFNIGGHMPDGSSKSLVAHDFSEQIKKMENTVLVYGQRLHEEKTKKQRIENPNHLPFQAPEVLCSPEHMEGLIRNLQDVLKACQRRLRTLKRMHEGQVISREDHQQLIAMITDDSKVKKYSNIGEEEPETQPTVFLGQ
ncbi:MAG: hypothetical protein Q8R79_05850 [Legionellaceae bacterium]|nr:hypothetical protein [Legionellaceae bacterium]